ncbi:MAG: hypothetical protein WCD79_17355 [Chthoniobacteraceae bacterium]
MAPARPLTLPGHRTIKGSTLRTILTQSGIFRDDFAGNDAKVGERGLNLASQIAAHATHVVYLCVFEDFKELAGHFLAGPSLVHRDAVWAESALWIEITQICYFTQGKSAEIISFCENTLESGEERTELNEKDLTNGAEECICTLR